MKKWSKLTDEELNKEHSKQKTILGIFLGIILVVISISIYDIIVGDIKVTTFLPVVFIPIAIIMQKNLRDVEKETDSRSE